MTVTLDILHLFELLIIIILGVALYIIIKTSKEEREQLYERIMAGTLADYKANTDDTPVPAGRNHIQKEIEKAHAKFLEN